MAHLIVEEAFRSRINAVVGPPDARIEGTFDKPTDLSSFVEIQFPFNQNTHHTIDQPGGRGYREEGGVRVLIFVPRVAEADKIAEGKIWARDIAARFRGAEFEGIRCMAPSSPIVDNSNDDGGYYGLSFVIPYEFHFQQEG